MKSQSSFALDLYRSLPAEGNLFFSPFSVRAALGRAAIGARGFTRGQFEYVLGLTGDDEAVAAWLGELEGSISGVQDVIMEVANKIYAQGDYSFVPAYLDLMRRFAGIETVDFRTQYETVRAAINSWVEQVTHQKIQNLLGSGALNALTRMVLVNAIYFKGDWASQFDKDLTRERDFHAPGGTVKVPLMYQQGTFLYAQTDRLQILRMPYKGDRLSMVIVLPREGVTLNQVEQEVTEGSALDTLMSRMRPEEDVKVYLPRFEFSWGTFEMTSVLKNLGIVDAFDPNLADFSGMVEGDVLYVSGVFHKSFIRTDEEGSEAAAATAVVMTREMLVVRPEIVFRADRPFMYVIRDAETDEYMFMGRVENPVK